MKLAIGCPTFQRAWCLPLWFDCLAAQHLDEIADEISLCFAYSKSYDGTYDVLQSRGSDYSELRIYQYDLATYSNRDLNRLPVLAQLRNALLEMVRETDADYFLSWDDDVLFKPDSVARLFDTVYKDTAVGALIDMGGNDKFMGHPSVMHFPQALGELAYRRPFQEYDWSDQFQCDIIMAVKLMGKEVYQNTQYTWDPVGEDIAWSLDAAAKGYQRSINPDVRGIHVYDKDIAIEIMKAFPRLEYPEILGPLSRWWMPRENWTSEPWV